MPRDGGPARLRLQQAALDLYAERGFDQVTIAEIAARAEVTERTFYRHFADKREVLFWGEQILRDALVEAIEGAPEDLAPLPTLLRAFRAAVPILERNRRFSEPLRHIVAASPALQERQHAKKAALIEALRSALCERGVAESTASLAAEIGMAAYSRAAAVWFTRPEQDFERILRETFEDLGALTAPLAEA